MKIAGKTLVNLFVVLCVVVSITSCGSKDEKQATEDLAPATVQPSSEEQVDDLFTIPPSPLDAFRSTNEQDSQIESAKWSYIDSCLKEKGYQNRSEKPTLQSIEEQNKALQQRSFDHDWGALSMSSAKKNGYRNGDSLKVPDASGDQVYVSGNGGNGTLSTQDGNEKEYTHEENACDMQFQDALFTAAGKPSEDDNNQYGALVQSATEAAHSNHEVKKSIADWSQCMKMDGYDYATPKDAVDEGWDYDNPPSPLEIATAVRDVKCKNEMWLMDIWYKALYDEQSKLIDKYRPMLERMKEAVAKKVECAQKVIAEN